MDQLDEAYIFDESDPLDVLAHIGRSKKDGAEVGSGRYPLGSGKNPFQQHGEFHSEYQQLLKEGKSVEEISKLFFGEDFKNGSSILRARDAYYAATKNDKMISKCCELSEKGLSNVKIAKELGISEGAVRQYLKKTEGARNKALLNTMDALKETIGTDGFVTVGKGTEARMNITKTRLDNAVINLVDQGEAVLYSDIRVKQGGSGNYTTVKTLAAPGVTKKDIYDNIQDMKIMNYRAEDGSGQEPLEKVEPPVNIPLDRVTVRYKDDPISGADMDGVIELRRGVPDLDLGNAHYAQVRIGIQGPPIEGNPEGKYYAKGMAVYADDLPDGVDIRVNSNKKRGAPVGGDGGYLKDQKYTKIDGESRVDEVDPFGASIKDQQALSMIQRHYIDKDGNKRLSSLNIVNEEGDWDRWSKNLPSQFLSKQRPQLAKEQLDIEATSRENEFRDIMQITNPTLKKQMLESFADNCDSAAVSLKAAALPRQQTHVILPVTQLKENEIFAPNYEPGEQVALVRFPHGGIFEIPVLTVNNNSRVAKSRIGTDARDAVGIHPKVAEQLSGADFDGDSVLVIPMGNNNIRYKSPLKELVGFDTKTQYATTKEDRESGAVSIIRDQRTSDTEMGKISNLITDMTLKGNASDDELARAVKHSMVIIDAKKHKLDYKRSEKDNRIEELKMKYQQKANPAPGEKPYGGAGTIVSRSKSQQEVPHRRQTYDIDHDTGAKIWSYTGETKEKGHWKVKTDPVTGRKMKDPVTKKEILDLDENGRKQWVHEGWEPKKTTSTRMYETEDAYELTSGGSKKNPGTQIEGIYAEYANRMKSLGNTARKASLAVVDIPVSKSAKETYAKEVDHLRWQLNEAKKNSPVEAKAQALAQAKVRVDKQENPTMTKGEESKLLDKALKKARKIVGAERKQIEINDREWEAIQAGAIPKTVLKDIFRFTDQDKLKERAMPKERKAPTKATLATMRSMLDRGFTNKEVADRFGISTTTLHKYMNSLLPNSSN